MDKQRAKGFGDIGKWRKSRLAQNCHFYPLPIPTSQPVFLYNNILIYDDLRLPFKPNG